MKRIASIAFGVTVEVANAHAMMSESKIAPVTLIEIANEAAMPARRPDGFGWKVARSIGPSLTRAMNVVRLHVIVMMDVTLARMHASGVTKLVRQDDIELAWTRTSRWSEHGLNFWK